MQNIPLPSQAAILNNAAASAAAAKAAKQPNATANEGTPFREVLAKQVKGDEKGLTAEQVLQRQRLQLQLKSSDEIQILNSSLIKPELIDGQQAKVQDEFAAVDVIPELQEAETSVLADSEVVATPAEGQPVLAAVTPDVQRKLAPQIQDELDVIDVKREPLAWLGKGKEQAEDLSLEKSLTTQLTPTIVPKAIAGNESVTQFAETLEQSTQVPLVATPSVQQPQLSQSAATALDVRGNQVPTPFGQPGWNQAIGQKVIWMAAGGEQTASLTLNPPDLGPLQVIIHVHNNQADTTFLSDQADVRRALEDGMDNLRQMMGESGLQLGQANVRSGQQEAQQQQATGMSSTNGNDTSGETSQVLAKAAKVMGLVDTFA